MKRILLIISVILLLLASCVKSPSAQPPLNETDNVATNVAATSSAMPSPTILPTLTSAPVTTATPEPSSAIRWITFHDPKLQITFEYPETWLLTPATAPPEWGSRTIIASPSEANGKTYSIYFGLYVNETIDPGENLLDWTTERDLTGGIIDPKDISSRESLRISGLEAVYTVMSFPEIRYTDIRRDNEILYVWADIGLSADDLYQDIYTHILTSFVSD